MLGGVVCAFAGIGEIVILDRLPFDGSMALHVVRMFLAVALVEELAKLGMIRFLAWYRPRRQEAYEAAILGAAVGLGFAAVENVGYLSSGSLEVRVAILMARTLFTAPMHACTGALLGYCSARTTGRRAANIGLGLGATVLLHGAFDAASGTMNLDIEAVPGGVATALVMIALALAIAVGCGVTLVRLTRSRMPLPVPAG